MRALVAVAAIAVLLAVAYALWGEQSQVSVSAQTGYIDLDFKVYGNPWMILGNQSYLGLSSTLLGSEEGNDGPPVLILTLKNLYPFGYEKGKKRYIVFDSLRLVNDGTIPVKITGCNFTYMSGSFEFGDVDNKGWLELDVDLQRGGRGPPRDDVVLKPGESAVVAISIWVSDNAPEGASVTVKFTCNYVQAVP